MSRRHHLGWPVLWGDRLVALGQIATLWLGDHGYAITGGISATPSGGSILTRPRRTIEGSILRSTTRDQLRIRSKSCPLSCRPAGALRLARRSSQESRPHLLRCSDVCLTGKTQIGRHEQRLCAANPRIAQGRRGHQDRSRSEMLLHLPFSTIVWPATPRTNRSLAAPPSRDCPTVEGHVTKMRHRAGTALST